MNMAKENLSPLRRRSPLGQVVGQTLAQALGQGQPVGASPFVVGHPHRALAPIDVVQQEPGHVSDAQAQVDHAQEDGVITLPTGPRSVNDTQQSVGIRRGQPLGRQGRTRAADRWNDRLKVAGRDALQLQEPEVAAQSGTCVAPSAIGEAVGQPIHVGVNACRSNGRRVNTLLFETRCQELLQVALMILQRAFGKAAVAAQVLDITADLCLRWTLTHTVGYLA